MTTPPSPSRQTEQVPPAAPAGFHPAPPASAAEKKGGKGKKILGIIAAAVVIGGIKFGLGYALNNPVHAKAGDCVSVTGSENDPDVSLLDCGDGKANYKVAKVVDNTFDTDRCGDGYAAALAQQWDDDKFVLCLNDK
ncbi:hypothetical protein LO771_23945 [Streptacidiphilus sp. ASG 303]|uniref:LppU/SCO3897 family protein n=1 Tax=Streptacidiphilus sp. ASG 303 TaxID=2896847 RepID=UPI001E3C61A5|nr:hypothetical protein [Streptacidiphilus sp. ASG 303]MCD0485355.1 hypothetical protein [Streptacidiphilus sp. ASG 303]